MSDDREYELRKGFYGPSVRVLCKPASAPSCDLCVQVKDPADPTGWRTVEKFNDMSNDYAHTNAHDTARRVRQKLVEGEQV